jgi:dTDP-glucose pyrophosphorylase
MSLADDATQDEIDFANKWWESTGQHSSYFKASLLDEPNQKIKAIHSPTFLREGGGIYKRSVMQSLMGAVGQSICAHSIK